METWKDIPGYEGLYVVSSLGQIKNLTRNIILKTKVKDTWYRYVSLTKNGKQKRFSLHRVLAITFIPNPENKAHVNHIDGVKCNNRLENLEWCTPRENSAHAVKMKLSASGEMHGRAKLNRHQVARIRLMKEITPNLGLREIGAMFGVSHVNIFAILSNKTWNTI